MKKTVKKIILVLTLAIIAGYGFFTQFKVVRQAIKGQKEKKIDAKETTVAATDCTESTEKNDTLFVGCNGFF